MCAEGWGSTWADAAGRMRNAKMPRGKYKRLESITINRGTSTGEHSHIDSEAENAGGLVASRILIVISLLQPHTNNK